MNKKIELPTKVNSYDLERVLVVEVPRPMLEPWCLGLDLLDHGIIDAIQIVDDRGRTALAVRLDRRLPTVRALLDEVDQGFHIRITQNELDYWTKFFLRYYANGWADVGHIDVELKTTPDEYGNKFGVTFKVDESGPSMQVDEFLRRVGLSTTSD